MDDFSMTIGGQAAMPPAWFDVENPARATIIARARVFSRAA